MTGQSSQIGRISRACASHRVGGSRRLYPNHPPAMQSAIRSERRCHNEEHECVNIFWLSLCCAPLSNAALAAEQPVAYG